jgi:hypothetical protein
MTQKAFQEGIQDFLFSFEMLNSQEIDDYYKKGKKVFKTYFEIFK